MLSRVILDKACFFRLNSITVNGPDKRARKNEPGKNREKSAQGESYDLQLPWFHDRDTVRAEYKIG